MIAIKPLLVAIAFVSGAATPSFAQIFWQNNTSAAITDDIWSVTYANGTFAAVTAQGHLLTSADGLAWSSQAVTPGTWLVSITYGNGTWIVVGDKGTILMSKDLKTWTSENSQTSNRLNGVLYDGSYFVAVGEGGTILSSPDGQVWTVQQSGVTGYLHGMTNFAWNEVFVCGEDGVCLIGNDDGTGFFQEPTGTTQNLEAILFQPHNPSVIVMVGRNGAIINDGDVGNDFQPSTISYSGTLRGLAFGNGYFVAAGEQGAIFTSSDGVTWTQRFSGDSPSTLSTATLLGAAFSPSPQRFVVVGTGGTILTSTPTPSTVFVNVSTRGTVSNTQPLIGGFVIEGSGIRTVLVRADGPSLGLFDVPNPLPDPVLTVYDSSGNALATIAGWTTGGNVASISSAAQAVGAFALPNPSKDSALLLTLQPGAYTAVITSAGGNSGTALFEAYSYFQ